MELFDTLDSSAREDLARRALDALLSPSEDWLGQHQAMETSYEVPTIHSIEGDLEGVAAWAETDEGRVDAELDTRAISSIAKDLGQQFNELAERVDTAISFNQAGFLDAIKASISWSTRNGIVDHPELDVERWMDMAHQLGLKYEVREILIQTAGPESLGRWWDHAPPLSENWSQAFQSLSRIVGHGRLSEPFMKQWLELLIDTPIAQWKSADAAKLSSNAPPRKTADEERTEAMKRLWAGLVSSKYCGPRPRNEWDDVISVLESRGLSDMSLIDWGEVLGDLKTSLQVIHPTQLQSRLTALFVGHPAAYLAWVGHGSGDVSKSNTYNFQRRGPNGSVHLSSAEAGRALKGASLSQMERIMEQLDEAARQVGLDTGYASAFLAAKMAANLEEQKPARPRIRL